MVTTDDFTLDDDEETEVDDKSNPMKTLRDHAKSLERKAKAYEKELEELRAFKVKFESEAKSRTAGEIFSQLGLSEKQAALFLKVNPDAEVDLASAKAFAEEYGFAIDESQVDESEAVETGGFSPSPTTGGKPAPGKIFSSEEWYALYKENPAEAMKIANQGRVKLQTEL